MNKPRLGYFCHACGNGAPDKIQHQYHPDIICNGPIEKFISIASLNEFLEEELKKDIYIEYGVNGIDSILNWLNQQTEGTHD